MYRLFAGLRLPAAISAQLLATMGGIAGARWQSAEQLHLTLRFIGEVDGRMAEDISLALAQVTAPPVTLALDGVGQFDSRGRPNAVWAGVRPHAPLAALHRKIDQALVRTGLAPEGRAYLPHITLARLNAASGATDRFLETHAGLTSAPFTIGHFHLFESTLGHGGADYTAIERYPLG
ncbi:RNA 2',3'-cyclic phosphodiesterase [Sphingomonas sp. CJ20]